MASHSHNSPLSEGASKAIHVLETQKIDYFLLGGLAVGVIGEPRATLDMDLDIFLSKEKLSGRPKDILDAEAIVLRHKGKLDIPYLEKWGRQLSEEAEDFRVFHQLQKVLKV